MQITNRREASRAASCCSSGRLVLLMGSGLLLVPKRYFRMPQQAQAFVTKVAHYQLDIADAITRGIRELGICSRGIEGQTYSPQAEPRRNCFRGASHQYASSRPAWGD